MSPRRLVLALLAAPAACGSSSSPGNAPASAVPIVTAVASPSLSDVGGFTDDFNRGLSAGQSGRWSLAQLQRGQAVWASGAGVDGTGAVRFTAGPKQGGQVGKADLVKRFDPLGTGEKISVSADFKFAAGTPMDSIILMDMECGTCGLDTNPGVRLYLREGRLRVERSKIGIKAPLLPNVDHRVTPDEWHHIEWRATLGKDADGRTDVFLDGRQVLSSGGTNLIDQRIVSELAPTIRVEEHIDRVQIGVTANSNARPVTLLMDNVRIESGF
jgi:hypothetical protein